MPAQEGDRGTIAKNATKPNTNTLHEYEYECKVLLVVISP